ncbi:MAG: hypothetical protein WCE90_03940 [Candidatus Zixiibacteriota bacterium]
MNVTLDYLRGRRSWVVPNFVVWGDWSIASFLILCSEMLETSKRLILAKNNLGGLDQVVNFSDLFDFRGNRLPPTIHNPKVMVLPKNETNCLVIGTETDTSFRIGRCSGSETTGLVDLMIVEMN